MYTRKLYWVTCQERAKETSYRVEHPSTWSSLQGIYLSFYDFTWFYWSWILILFWSLIKITKQEIDNFEVCFELHELPFCEVTIISEPTKHGAEKSFSFPVSLGGVKSKSEHLFINCVLDTKGYNCEEKKCLLNLNIVQCSTCVPICCTEQN